MEDLRSDTATEHVESGSRGLAWVAIHEGEFVADWTRDGADQVHGIYSVRVAGQHDKNEQPEPDWEEELETDECIFYPSQRDDEIAKTLA